MGSIFGRLIIILCGITFLASAGHARPLKTVYLKDGGMIDCETFWKKDGKIVVKVNRDTVVDFDRSEVDLQRTLGKKSGKAKKHKITRKTAVAAGAKQNIQKVISSARKPIPARPKSAGSPPATGAPAAQAPSTTPLGVTEGVRQGDGKPGRTPAAPSKVPVAAPAANQGGATKPGGADKPVVLGGTTSAKKPDQPVPVAKPAEPPKPAPAPLPPPKKPFLDLQTIGIGALLVLLIVALLLRQRKGKSV